MHTIGELNEILADLEVWYSAADRPPGFFLPVGGIVNEKMVPGEQENGNRCYLPPAYSEEWRTCMSLDMFLISVHVPDRKKMTGGVD